MTLYADICILIDLTLLRHSCVCPVCPHVRLHVSLRLYFSVLSRLTFVIRPIYNAVRKRPLIFSCTGICLSHSASFSTRLLLLSGGELKGLASSFLLLRRALWLTALAAAVISICPLSPIVLSPQVRLDSKDSLIISLSLKLNGCWLCGYRSLSIAGCTLKKCVVGSK